MVDPLVLAYEYMGLFLDGTVIYMQVSQKKNSERIIFIVNSIPLFIDIKI